MRQKAGAVAATDAAIGLSHITASESAAAAGERVRSASRRDGSLAEGEKKAPELGRRPSSLPTREASAIIDWCDKQGEGANRGCRALAFQSGDAAAAAAADEACSTSIHLNPSILQPVSVASYKQFHQQ